MWIQAQSGSTTRHRGFIAHACHTRPSSSTSSSFSASSQVSPAASTAWRYFETAPGERLNARAILRALIPLDCSWMSCLSVGVGILGFDIGGSSSVRELPPSVAVPTGPFTSHLVTPPPPARRCAHALQSLAAASSLVTAKEPIFEAPQGLAPASALVPRASLAAVLAHIPDSPPATLEPGSRAAGRRSTAGSPALRATGFGSLACSQGGTLAWSNIAAGHGCAGRRNTAPGSTGIDVVLFFSRGRVLLTPIMPIIAAAARPPGRPPTADLAGLRQGS